MQITNLCRMTFSLISSYTVMGLTSTAKPTDIKKKYYQLAKLYHPDINSDTNAHAKFNQINKAYKKLMDQVEHPHQHTNQASETHSNQKKSTFYQQAQSFTNKNQKNKRTAAEDEQYEDLHEYDDFFKHAKKFRKPKIGEDISINVTISLKESILGVKKTISYTMKCTCPTCEDKQFAACFSCGGKGQIYNRMERERMKCTSCDGKGYQSNCSQCHGSCFITKDVSQQMFIEKGIQDKTILKVERAGSKGFKHHNGDLYVTVFVLPSEKFHLDGNNVHSEHQLDFVTATCGGTTKIETLFGVEDFFIEPGTQSGSEIRIFDKGLKSQFSNRKGDQIVKIKIKIPQKLSNKQRKLLEKLKESEISS